MIIKIKTINGEDIAYKNAEIISLKIRVRQNEHMNLKADIDCDMVERFEFNRESEVVEIEDNSFTR